MVCGNARQWLTHDFGVVEIKAECYQEKPLQPMTEIEQINICRPPFSLVDDPPNVMK